MTWWCWKWSNWCKNWWSKWKQVKEPFFALCLANIIFHCYCYCLLTYYKRVRTQSKGNVPIDTINYQWLATLKCLQKSTTSFNIQYLFIFKKCLFFPALLPFIGLLAYSESQQETAYLCCFQKLNRMPNFGFWTTMYCIE